MTSERYERDRRYDAKRKAHPDHAFRRTREWRDRIRRTILLRDPFCVVCLASGRHTPSTDVDHIRRPMGNPHLQRSPDNLRGICASCHARKTRDEERPYHKAVDIDGYPLDKRHPCYRSAKP
jgi:5-methylcytosine-specific restriction protein A